MDKLVHFLSVTLAIACIVLILLSIPFTDKDYQQITVEIVDGHRRPMISTGRVTVPSDYTIFVLYNGTRYDVDVSSELYDVFMGMIGTSVPAYYCVETRNNEIVNTYITFSK